MPRPPQSSPTAVPPAMSLGMLVVFLVLATPHSVLAWGSTPQDLPTASETIPDNTDAAVLPRARDIPRYIRATTPERPRYHDNQDGTVTDLFTGLLWLKRVDCLRSATWEKADALVKGLSHGHACADFTLEDHSAPGDWRLPTIREIMTLPNQKYYNPALSDTLGVDKWSEDDPFVGVSSPYYYWSATRFDTNKAWYLDLSNGIPGLSLLSEPNAIWPVRGTMAFRWQASP